MAYPSSMPTFLLVALLFSGGFGNPLVAQERDSPDTLDNQRQEEGRPLTDEEMSELLPDVEAVLGTDAVGIQSSEIPDEIPTIFTLSGGAYAVCRVPGFDRPSLHCNTTRCRPGETLISIGTNRPSCRSQNTKKEFCDPRDAWTGWITVGSGVGNPPK